MRKMFVFLLVFIFLLKQGFAVENLFQEKIYISSENVYLHENNILIELDSQIVNVCKLFCDNKGYYITYDSIIPEFKKWKTWTCPECGYENSFSDSVCQNPDCPSQN